MEDLKLNQNYYTDSKNSIENVIRMMNVNKIGFLAVVDVDFKLLGIITDSDLRKAFLESKKDLLDIMNANPIKMLDDEPRQLVITKLKKMYLRHMPIVDKKNVLKDIIVLAHEERKFKSNKVIIMAGGLGTRLGKLTENTPKPMLNLGKKPILEHIIKSFCSYGFSKFSISVNYKQEIIKDYFRDGSKLGVEIEYIEEKKKLGTIGALSLLKDTDESFFVINSDIITSLNFDDLIDFHHKNKDIATICVRNRTFSIPYGIINKNSNGKFKNMQEKPDVNFLVNAGIYVFSPEIKKFLKKNEYCDIPDLLHKIKSDNKSMNLYQFSDFWIDIGTQENYKEIKDKYSGISNFLKYSE